MIYRLMWKNFKSYIGKYLLYFSGIIFSIAVMVCFVWIKHFMGNVQMSNPQYDFSGITFTVENYYYMVIIITVIFLSYIIKQYIQLRIKDYSMLLVLGIKRKQMSSIIVFEYVCIWVITLVSGIVVGFGLSQGITAVIELNKKFIIPNAVNWARIIVSAVSYSLFIFLAVVIYQLQLMRKKDIYTYTSNIKKQGKLVVKPWWKWLAVLGLFVVVAAFVLLTPHFYTNKSIFYSIFLCLAGVYLLITFGIGSALQYFRKSSKLYYRNLLKINQFYVEFTKNKKIIYLSFAINFIILFLIGIFTIDNMFADYSANYPFDFLIKDASYQQEETLKSQFGIDDKYKISYVQTVGCGAGEDPEIMGREFIGISQSSYEKMTEKQVEMQKDEAFVVSQRGKSDSYIVLLPQNADTYVNGREINVVYSKQKTEVLFWGMGRDTDVIVFADDVFHENALEKETSNFLLVNIASEDEDNLQEELSGMEGIKVYQKSVQLQIKRTEALFTALVNVLIGITLMVSCLLMLSIRLFSEVTEQKEKHYFLYCMGMTKKEQRKMLKGEIRIYILVPAGIALLCALFFYIFTMAPEGLLNRQNIFVIGSFLVICMIPEILYYKIIKGVILNKVGLLKRGETRWH